MVVVVSSKPRSRRSSGRSKRTTQTIAERELGMSLPEDIRNLPTEEVLAGQSLVGGMTPVHSSGRSRGRAPSRPTTISEVRSEMLGQTFESSAARQAAEQAFKQKTTAELRRSLPTRRPTNIQQQLGLKEKTRLITSQIKAVKAGKVTPAKLRKFRKEIKIPETVKAPQFSRKETVTTIPRQDIILKENVPKIDDDFILIEAAKDVSKMTKKVAEGLEKVTKKALGDEKKVRVTYKDIEQPDIKIFERGTGIVTPEGRVTIPKPEITTKRVKVSKIIRDPGAAAKVVGVTASVAPYIIPVLGTTVLAGDVATDVEKIKETKIPTKSELVEELTPGFTTKERNEYLKTKEGKDFLRDVERQIIERKRALGSKVVGLGVETALLGAEGVIRGARALKDKTIVKGAIPKPKIETVRIVEPTKKIDKLAFTPVRTETVVTIPTRLGREYTTRDIVLGKLSAKPKTVTITPKQKFFFKGEFATKKGTALGVVARTKPGGKATTMFLAGGKAKPIPSVGKLSKMEKFIVTKASSEAGRKVTVLPKGFEKGLISGEGVATQVARITPKRITPLKTKPVKSISIGKTRQVEATATIPIGRTTATVKIPGGATRDVSFIKTTTSTKPIRSGKILAETGVTIRAPKKTTERIINIDKPTTRLKAVNKKIITAVAEAESAVLSKGIPKPTNLIPKPKPSVTLINPTRPIRAVTGVKQETTITNVAPKPITVQPQKMNQLKPLKKDVTFLTTPIEKVKPVEVVKIDSRGRQKTRVKQRIKQEEETIMAQVQKPVQEVAQIQETVSETKMRTILKPKIPEVLSRVPIPALIVPKVSKIRPPKVSKIRHPKVKVKLEDNLSKKKISKKSRKKDLLIPFIRRRGKFVAVGPALERERAIKKGVTKLRRTLAASLQLRRPSGEVVPFAKESREFRLGKGNGVKVLVQRAPQRLGRAGEIAEIIASRTAGRVKFI